MAPATVIKLAGMIDSSKGRAIDPHIERVRAAATEFGRALDAVGLEGLERTTPSGWTGKEMLTHVAFWDEAVFGVIEGMFRSRLPEGWRFGSGYAPDPNTEWPVADVHNAREAAWARGRTAAEVVQRWRAGQEQLYAVLDTVTDDEVTANHEYFASLGAHYDEHRPELEG